MEMDASKQNIALHLFMCVRSGCYKDSSHLFVLNVSRLDEGAFQRGFSLARTTCSSARGK